MVCQDNQFQAFSLLVSILKLPISCLVATCVSELWLYMQSRANHESLLEQTAQLAKKDSRVLKQLYALDDGTQESLEVAPPVTLFQGAKENRNQMFEESAGKLSAFNSLTIVKPNFLKNSDFFYAQLT